MDATAQMLAQVLIKSGAYLEGNFTLHNGSSSPYFLNFGNVCQANHLAILGDCFAKTLVESGINFDILYGPPYKGIALAVATITALNGSYGLNRPYAASRKEAKTHGEQGSHLGAPIKPGARVVIVDDVITSGGTKLEAAQYITNLGGIVVAYLIGVDRTSDPSVLQALTEQTGAPVLSVLRGDDIQQAAAQHSR